MKETELPWKMDVDVKAPTDTDRCDVADMVVLPSSNLLVADFKNKSVKVVDVQTGCLLSHLHLPGYPYSLCLLPGDRAAVSLPFMRNIHIINVSTDQINLLKIVDVEVNCFGLAYMNDTFVVGCSAPQSAVALINIEGNVLKSVSKDNAGNTLFSYPTCIPVTTESNAPSIYVSDWRTRTITRLSEELKVLQTFQYPTQPGTNGMNPAGMVPAGAGQLLVRGCGRDNPRLWVLDTNTGESKELLGLGYMHMEGDYNVSARVAFCPRLGRVYINTRYSAYGKSDFINVYEIS